MHGFTLVELLVVITIIAILIPLFCRPCRRPGRGLRRLQCSNNLKQLALAMVHHEGQYGYFPSGGWNWEWCADPDRGTGREQPGGWPYPVLPYLEQMALYNLGSDFQPNAWTPTQWAGEAQRTQTPLAVHTCPTRRRCTMYAFALCSANRASTVRETTPPMARTPSAAPRERLRGENPGDQTVQWVNGIVTNLSQAASLTATHSWPNVDAGPVAGQPGTGPATGICYFRSQVRMSRISPMASEHLFAGGEVPLSRPLL